MILSQKAIDEFKAIFEKKYHKKLTNAEASESAHNLVGFFEVLYEIAEREAIRTKRLEKEPKGFYLEDDGKVYNCLICHNTISGKTGWWDKWGQKCLNCQRNINAGVIPPDICKNDKIWFKNWQLKEYFGIHPSKVQKLRRTGELKGIDLLDEKGWTYLTVFLVKDNVSFLKKYSKNKK
ncbi:hypothetical protein M1271_05735 [Patescibacteria group bacterium]|nr:hypothetical protein [Patescibacteria group bacterium]